MRKGIAPGRRDEARGGPKRADRMSASVGQILSARAPRAGERRRGSSGGYPPALSSSSGQGFLFPGLRGFEPSAVPGACELASMRKGIAPGRRDEARGGPKRVDRMSASVGQILSAHVPRAVHMTRNVERHRVRGIPGQKCTQGGHRGVSPRAIKLFRSGFSISWAERI